MRVIYLALFEYAHDHNGEFPVGPSSTAVFQKLIDGHYIASRSDPNQGSEGPSDDRVVYYPLPGKVPPTSDTIRPENVSWDLVVPATDQTPEQMPLVILTGYRVQMKPNGGAVPRNRPLPTWTSWLNGVDYPRNYILTVSKMGNGRCLEAGPDHPISNLIPSVDEFAKLKDSIVNYRQLTPDGSAP